MHAVGIWCKTKIQIDPGGLEVNFSLQVGKKVRHIYLKSFFMHGNIRIIMPAL